MRSRACAPDSAWKELAQGGGDQPALGGPAVLVHVADEVRRAALPRAGKHPLDRVPQAFVLVRDGQAHAPKPAGPQRAQELDPEGL